MRLHSDPSSLESTMGRTTSGRATSAAPKDAGRRVPVLPLPASPPRSRQRGKPALSGFQSVWDAEALVQRRIRAQRGDILVHEGQRFDGLLLVRSGSCKSSLSGANGQDQITGYHIAGEVLGAEAICTGTHSATTTALEDIELWVLPLERIQAAARGDPALHHHFCAFLSNEIARDQRAMLMLGTMRAEHRVAIFLLDLANRYGRSGHSPREVVLRMTRQEIGLHLGLSVETVSRVLSRMRSDGLVQVRGRNVELVDEPRLRGLAVA
jgi:CRP/FNR family transcriptional regulator